MTINQFSKFLLGAVLAFGAITQVKADDKKVDPTGTYQWTIPARNGGADRTNTLVLKLDGDTLTGKLSSPGRGGKINETAINDAKLTGADVSFSVVRTYNDNNFTNKFTGTITNDVIKGKMAFTRDGDTQSRDWEAKLQK